MKILTKCQKSTKL